MAVPVRQLHYLIEFIRTQHRGKICWLQLPCCTCIQCCNVQAVSLLRPGGVLVYSTCTITVEENEAVVVWAVNTFHQQLQLVDQVIVALMNVLRLSDD